jgi:hypothetical protein
MTNLAVGGVGIVTIVALQSRIKAHVGDSYSENEWDFGPILSIL